MKINTKHIQNGLLRCFLTATIGTGCFQTSYAAFEYVNYSEGRRFFADGQQWTFIRHREDENHPPVEVRARVEGDTAISTYMDYYGDIVQIVQPCKKIIVTHANDPQTEKRYAAYEWDAEVYVHSEKVNDFVQMLGFCRKENVKFLFCGEKWNAEHVDYTAPHGEPLKRCVCRSMVAEKSYVSLYKAGADRVWLSGSKWTEGGMLELAEYHAPDGTLYSPADFEAPLFVPDNAMYPEGKEWVYASRYHETHGNPDRLVHMRVEDDETLDHVACKRAVYSLDGGEAGHASAVCSHDGVMYERGYMGLLNPRFDFNIVAGDLAKAGLADSRVTGIDISERDGVKRRRINFAGESNTDSEWKYWVEGIGGNAGNDMLPWSEMEDFPEIYMPGTFSVCNEMGFETYSLADFSAGRSDVGEMFAHAGANEGNIYTLDGLKAHLAPGRLVVCGGRKLLLRR